MPENNDSLAMVLEDRAHLSLDELCGTAPWVAFSRSSPLHKHLFRPGLNIMRIRVGGPFVTVRGRIY